MPCRKSGNRLHQATATSTTIGVIIIGCSWLEQGINTECRRTEHTADQFQRNATSTDLDEFTHAQRISLVPM